MRVKRLLKALEQLEDALAVIQAMRLFDDAELRMVREWAAEAGSISGSISGWFFGGCADQVWLERTKEVRA